MTGTGCDMLLRVTATTGTTTVLHRARRRCGVRRFVALIVCGTMAIPTRPVRAQSTDDAAATERRELIQQAQRARNAGDHTQALELAQRAGRTGMTPSLRLFIAQTQQSLGRLGEAVIEADRCIREAESDMTARNRDTVLATCRALAASVRPRVGRIVLRIPADAPADLTVTIAGQSIASADFGAPHPVTPGVVDVVVDGREHGRFQASITVAGGASVDVVARLVPRPVEPLPVATPPVIGTNMPPPNAASTPVVVAAPTATMPTGSVSAPTPVRDTREVQGPSAGPWALVILGGASFVGSVGFWVAREVNLAACPDRMCATQGHIDRVYGFTTTSIVTFGAAIVLVPLGVVWSVAGRVRAAGARASEMSWLFGVPQLRVTHDGGWVSFGGTF